MKNCLLIAFLLTATAASAAEEGFVYESGPVRYTVTAEGLSKVEVDGATVATGGWYAYDAGPRWFGRGDGNHPAAKGNGYDKLANLWQSRSLERLDANHVRVTHESPGIRAVTDYRFAGPDVSISCRLENLDDRIDLHRAAMGGLLFDFGQVPEGRLPCWHTSYMRVAEGGIFHPNHNNQIGGTWGCGKAFAVGTSPQRVGMVQTMTHWDFADWARQARGPRRWLSFLRRQDVPAGGAIRMDLLIRMSRPTTDWKYLMAPYKAYFREVYGPAQYGNWDARPMIMACINHSPGAIRPENPYGFHGGFRRMDLPVEANAFADQTIAILKAANGQGTIIWGLTGQHPKGGMYRPDFDCLPKEVWDNFRGLIARYKQAGLKIGVCTRPPHTPWPLTYYKDGIVNINVDDAQQLDLLHRRFKNMIDAGCDLFYLDSYGSSFDDVKSMRYLRGRLGPDIQTYAEHPCDAISPYTGFYTETDGVKPKDDPNGAVTWRPRTSLELLETCRWLLDRDVPTVTRGGPVEWRFEHHITPLISDYLKLEDSRAVGDLTRKYLDGENYWRK